MANHRRIVVPDSHRVFLENVDTGEQIHLAHGDSAEQRRGIAPKGFRIWQNGQTVTVKGGATPPDPQQLARIQLEEDRSDVFTVYAFSTIAFGGFIGTPGIGIFPQIDITWGAGNGSTTKSLDATVRSIETFVANNISVSASLRTTVPGIDTTGVTATISAFIVSGGLDKQPFPASKWVKPTGGVADRGVISSTPCLLQSCFGFNAGAAAKTIMLFDIGSTTVPSGAGVVPELAALVSSLSAYSFKLGAPKSFTNGCVWYASDNSASLVSNVANSFRVDAEIIR